MKLMSLGCSATDLAPLAGQLKPHQLHDLIDARLIRERAQQQRLGEIVRLGHHDKPARPGHTRHLGERSRGIPQVDQHGLAGREIEGVVGEWNALRRAEPIAEALPEPTAERTRARLLHPGWLPVDARDAGARGQHRRQEQAPVTHAAADVEHIAHGVEAPATGQELQEVAIPPVVAAVPEVLRRMPDAASELVAHRRATVSG